MGASIVGLCVLVKERSDHRRLSSSNLTTVGPQKPLYMLVIYNVKCDVTVVPFTLDGQLVPSAGAERSGG